MFVVCERSLDYIPSDSAHKIGGKDERGLLFNCFEITRKMISNEDSFLKP